MVYEEQFPTEKAIFPKRQQIQCHDGEKNHTQNVALILQPKRENHIPKSSNEISSVNWLVDMYVISVTFLSSLTPKLEPAKDPYFKCSACKQRGQLTTKTGWFKK